MCCGRLLAGFRHGQFSNQGTLLYEMIPQFVDLMQEPYPELIESRDRVSRLVLAERRDLYIR